MRRALHEREKGSVPFLASRDLKAETGQTGVALVVRTVG